jgi:hypothetical protein
MPKRAWTLTKKVRALEVSPTSGACCIPRPVVQCMAVEVLQAAEALPTTIMLTDVTLACVTPIPVCNLIAM